jgi:hypothetical protein
LERKGSTRLPASFSGTAAGLVLGGSFSYRGEENEALPMEELQILFLFDSKVGRRFFSRGRRHRTGIMPSRFGGRVKLGKMYISELKAYFVSLRINLITILLVECPYVAIGFQVFHVSIIVL